MAADVNAIIAELQEQLRLLSSRAAQLAGQLATLASERDELQKKVDEHREGNGTHGDQ